MIRIRIGTNDRAEGQPPQLAFAEDNDTTFCKLRRTGVQGPNHRLETVWDRRDSL
ncbi:hypothetical protein [Streptacidiphilus sp. EB129]|uniref:hypothetical protein n=1 Tax=Streptacidiphilus sp. EB129 TaxID=3156262 RepID=UPI0035142F6A